MEVANGQQQRKRSREEKLVRRRDYWSRQFACPEWMLDVPEDLNGAGSTEGEGERDSVLLPSSSALEWLYLSDNCWFTIPSHHDLRSLLQSLLCMRCIHSKPQALNTRENAGVDYMHGIFEPRCCR
eukprot:TRINITY_DN1540_c0_g1_i1.p1 TRINITY_DN1540_c0_g1~~TRINITY_DN1540_c0_g1_i1.p1  ORF type:complete len:126 (-),score=5.10 TRINITY_DN1540_c0_g1_i1:1633-2010(-)